MAEFDKRSNTTVLSAKMERLVEKFQTLPGIGQKNAQRLAFFMLGAPQKAALEFADAIRDACENSRLCRECLNFAETDLCALCASETRDKSTVCVVETALDVLVQLNILKEIRKIQRARRMAIIYISHDVGVIAQVSDYVAVMYAGRIVEYGAADAVFNKPQHPYTRALLDSSLSATGVKKELRPLEGEPPNLIEVRAGCSFQPRCRYAVERCETDEPLERDSETAWCLCWRAGVASGAEGG